MDRASVFKGLRSGALALTLLCIAQPAWASHWFMTGLIENGKRVAGVDQASIVDEPEGLRRVTLISFMLEKGISATTTGELDIDCAKQQFQQIRLLITHEDGRRATILSRGGDWERPTNASDAGLLEAACTGDFSELTDIQSASPEQYVAGQLQKGGQ